MAVLEWLADQPWCTGRLGMWGISWGGFSALQTAMLRPPMLQAICAMHATHDRFATDVHYIGGALHLFEQVDWPVGMAAQNLLPPDPAIVGERWEEMWRERLAATPQWLPDWLEHQARDEFWRHGSPCEDYGSITAATLLIGGWLDPYVDGMLDLLAHLDAPRRAVIGPWGHHRPATGAPGPTLDHFDLLARWFAHWLADEDTGVMDDPLLTMYVRTGAPYDPVDGDAPGRWRAEPAWPLADGADMTLHLDRGTLAGGPPEASDVSPLGRSVDGGDGQPVLGSVGRRLHRHRRRRRPGPDLGDRSARLPGRGPGQGGGHRHRRGRPARRSPGGPPGRRRPGRHLVVRHEGRTQPLAPPRPGTPDGGTGRRAVRGDRAHRPHLGGVRPGAPHPGHAERCRLPGGPTADPGRCSSRSTPAPGSPGGWCSPPCPPVLPIATWPSRRPSRRRPPGRGSAMSIDRRFGRRRPGRGWIAGVESDRGAARDRARSRTGGGRTPGWRGTTPTRRRCGPGRSPPPRWRAAGWAVSATAGAVITVDADSLHLAIDLDCTHDGRPVWSDRGRAGDPTPLDLTGAGRRGVQASPRLHRRAPLRPPARSAHDVAQRRDRGDCGDGRTGRGHHGRAGRRQPARARGGPGAARRRARPARSSAPPPTSTS